MATRRVMANSDIIPPLFDKSRKEIVNSSTIGIDFLGNALSNDLVDIIYEGTRLKWCNDLDSLKAFVAEVLDLNGKWCSPGGGSKRFTSSNAELTLTWYSGKQNTLLFQGKDGNLIRDGCVKFCQTRDGVMKSSCKQVQALSKNSELQRDLIAQNILESEPTSISRPANQVDAASQVCLDIIGDNSNYLSNCRCSCGVLAADVKGVKLDITILSNRIDSIANANTEYSHKDKEIDRLRSELSIEKARSEKLESELSLFVKERSLEIEKLNQTIVSLENKIIEHDKSNASLKLFIDIDQQRISKPQIPEQSNYKQSASPFAAPMNNNNSKINKNTLMNKNNRNGHRNNGHHNNSGLNQCKSQNVSLQPFIPAPVNNRDPESVPFYDTNRDLQNKALQINQIANRPEKQPISDWIGSLPLIDIPIQAKNNQHINRNTSNKLPFPKRHRTKPPSYRTGHRHQSLEWLSHLDIVHQLCKR